MAQVFVVNGSPRLDKGNTGLILSSFLQGLELNGTKVDLFYASRLKVNPCNCGHLYCWNRTPGECIHKDSMQEIFPTFKQADLLVIATPVYTPIPGDLQNFINRLTPLINPKIELREGRTRAQFRDDVRIKKIMLVAAGGWWEPENFGTVIRIVEELAAVAGVSFGGAVIRPHAHHMWKEGQLTKDAHLVLQMVEEAAGELIREGEISEETLAAIRQPLISKADFFHDW
jgi:multimeric flavodoxin WrbA